MPVWERMKEWWRFSRVGLGTITESDGVVPYLSSGDGAPTEAAPNGSVYLRRNGSSATTIYARVSNAWNAIVAAGTNFGSGGIAADVIAESTATVGVTVDGALIKDGSFRVGTITDPGNAGAIPVDKSGICNIVTAGAETRTLAIPTFAGQKIILSIDTDGGTCVITSAQTLNATGNNTITMADVRDIIVLEAVTVGGALRWAVTGNDGSVLSTV